MKRSVWIILLIAGIHLSPFTIHSSIAQDVNDIPPLSFGLGVRTTGSVFVGDNANGFGAGGHHKILFSHRVNSEWFLDIMNSTSGQNGFRKDTHIGWSVQFAVNKAGYQTNKVIPFVEAGQCFDWTKVGFVDTLVSFAINPEPGVPHLVGPIFSVATQVGTGVSFFPTSRIELCAEMQYMIHLTKDVHLEFDQNNVAYKIEQAKGTSFDGHILGTISFTYYLIQKKS